MEGFVALLIFADILLLVVGFFSPKTSLFWYKQERTKKKSLTYYWLSLIVLFILFGAFSDKTTDVKDNSSVSDNSSVPELTQVQKDSISEVNRITEIETRKNQTFTAVQLTQEYVANEVRADENFKDKYFYVEGNINDIKKDIMDEIYVTLEGSEMFREVQCYFDDKGTASQLEKGMRVTFYGKCDGLMMNVLMKNCKLVANLKDLEKAKK